MKRRQPRYTLLPYATLFRSLRRLIRVDVDPAQLHKNAPADVAVLGDARSVLERLPVRTASEDLRSVRAAIREEAQIGRHTSELQSRQYIVCRLLLEKKKTNY